MPSCTTAIQNSATVTLISSAACVVYVWGYRRSESLHESSIPPLSKRLPVIKPTLQACVHDASQSHVFIQMPSRHLLLTFGLRTSTAYSPSCAQAAVGSLPSLAPSLFLCLLAPLPLQLSPIHSSRGRARFGPVPTSSYPPSILGPIGLRACGGIGGERTNLRRR